jgi:hypothetical protein
VESSCECGYEPSGSIKCWETIKWLHNWWPLEYSQFHRVSYRQMNGERKNKQISTLCHLPGIRFVAKFISALNKTEDILPYSLASLHVAETGILSR